MCILIKAGFVLQQENNYWHTMMLKNCWKAFVSVFTLTLNMPSSNKLWQFGMLNLRRFFVSVTRVNSYEEKSAKLFFKSLPQRFFSNAYHVLYQADRTQLNTNI